MYKVLNAMKAGSYTGKFGEIIKYSVMLEGESEAVEVSQKPETPAPKIGDELEGTIENTTYGRRFKKAQQSFGGKSPEQQASIIRQHSQEMALRYCQLKGKTDIDFKDLQIVIDWFEADTKGVRAEKKLTTLTTGQTTGQTTVSASSDEPPFPENEVDIESIDF